MFPEPITGKRPATKEEVERIMAMFNLRNKLEITMKKNIYKTRNQRPS